MAIEPKCLPACAPNTAGELPVRPGTETPTGSAGIEIGFAPLGCTFDANGEQTGSVFTAETRADEPGSPSTYRMVHVSTAGVVTDPYLGTWEDCDRVVLDPVQFCFTATSTGNVEHPGREYDVLLPLNPGFAVESIVIDGVVTPENLVWDVNDPTGQAFADELETRLFNLLPNAGTIIVTPPVGGQSCGSADPFQIHIQCLRLDQSPPDTIRFNYNGGQDLIQNPAYNETPPLSPPVSQGNYGYHLLARQDDPGPFPGFPPSGRADCTSVANRGWETNDSGRTFEIWGQDVAGGVTATPRGTPIQEVNSDGNGPEGGTTIWQTFQVTANGNFNIRLVHGGRDPGETHTIRLSTGDTNFTGTGDLINNVTNPNTVYGGGAWTVLNQMVALTPGLYTLSFKSSTPVGGARGGLFTDMRAFVDVPGQFVDMGRTDGDCTVTTLETVTTTTCEFWQPRTSANGDIVSWRNAEDGEELTNAAFWGQVPSPECCTGSAGGEGGGTVTPGNLVQFYEVCGVVGGIPTTLQRIVFTNQSGGVVAGSFIGPDGGPVTPASWTVGACPLARPDGVDVEITNEPGCANGVPYTRRTIWRYNATTGALISVDQVYVDSDGAGVIAPPEEFQLGSCINRVRLYTSTVETVSGILRVVAPVIPDPDPLITILRTLVSWSVRHRSGTVTIQSSNDDLDAPSIVTMDPGEVISFDAGDDPNGGLNSPAIIDATAGSVRVTYQYRIPGTANVDIA